MNRPTTRHERDFWRRVGSGTIDLEFLFYRVENYWLDKAIDEGRESGNSQLLETYPNIIGQLGLLRSCVSVVLDSQGEKQTLSNIKNCLLQHPHAAALLASLTSDIRKMIAQEFLSHIGRVAHDALCSTKRIKTMACSPEGKLQLIAMRDALASSANSKLGLRDLSS